MTNLTDREGGFFFPVELIDEQLENVLKASGSSLRHYSLQSIKAAMRKAMSDAMRKGFEASK